MLSGSVAPDARVSNFILYNYFLDVHILYIPHKRNGGIEHVLGKIWEKWMEVDIKDCELWLKIVL